MHQIGQITRKCVQVELLHQIGIQIQKFRLISTCDIFCTSLQFALLIYYRKQYKCIAWYVSIKYYFRHILNINYITFIRFYQFILQLTLRCTTISQLFIKISLLMFNIFSIMSIQIVQIEKRFLGERQSKCTCIVQLVYCILDKCINIQSDLFNSIFDNSNFIIKIRIKENFGTISRRKNSDFVDSKQFSRPQTSNQKQSTVFTKYCQQLMGNCIIQLIFLQNKRCTRFKNDPSRLLSEKPYLRKNKSLQCKKKTIK
eukprot:TRINITY_DN8711_c0_g3_i1.p2 TRINITY_DN8711_c0_g3~~TRINITY_DN8711_c0_g3_i1.p2  ORF type:complete len:257 (+),score=-18.04 TRINITY_DN8711_c0_g3_i1:414-1184(+)